VVHHQSHLIKVDLPVVDFCVNGKSFVPAIDEVDLEACHVILVIVELVKRVLRVFEILLDYCLFVPFVTSLVWWHHVVFPQEVSKSIITETINHTWVIERIGWTNKSLPNLIRYHDQVLVCLL